MNKVALKQAIETELYKILDVAMSATQRAIESATDEETVPEHKYDTLALEAAYLAHGQAQRVAECEQDIARFKELKFREFEQDAPAALSALVELIDDSDHSHWFFLSPVAGGTKVDFSGLTITLLTPQAPLAKLVIGKLAGDEIELSVGEQSLTYFIEQVI
ncbi:transcription elongation factor [Vibrio sp. SCSIO 43136]|uniref:transcription elongation factor n=1 Tax=Vibrio sp. SCSIO 43136 TaxID=2819101 RepID=UPI002074B207|nr:transcription elongation factor [Vibrio sp. SCSIO 43136]USD64693.1 transcription elongation factor [Vibrio sp. SCSIO 43136]